MASVVVLAVAGCELFCGVSLRSAPVAVDLSVKLNVTAGEGVSNVLLLEEEVLKRGDY